MNKISQGWVFSALCASLCASAHAAPLDAFLSANKPTQPGSVELEASYDMVNSTVDVFNIRSKDSDFSGTSIGDYKGAHIRGGVAVLPSLWIDGGLWERQIEYRQDQQKIKSWQLGAQYKLLEGEASGTSVALRASAWGNQASRLEKNSPTSFQGFSTDSFAVNSPKDRQAQLDLIASFSPTERLELSGFVGAGRSEVKVGKISGTTSIGGCSQNISFNPNEVLVTPDASCGSSGDYALIKNSATGIDVYKESQYKANFAHVGVSGKWNNGPWQLRAGYQFQVLDRKNIDDKIKNRGGKVVDNNHVVVGEVSYKVSKNVALFGRGQYMHNQFTGEIPFAYNSVTSHRFDKHYGLVSVGLMMEF